VDFTIVDKEGANKDQHFSGVCVVNSSRDSCGESFPAKLNFQKVTEVRMH
jgi:hypothetical protein